MRLFAEYLLNLKSNGVVSALSNIKVIFLNTLVGLRIARIPLDPTSNFSTEGSDRENAHKNVVHLCFLAETEQRVVFVIFFIKFDPFP